MILAKKYVQYYWLLYRVDNPRIAEQTKQISKIKWI